MTPHRRRDGLGWAYTGVVLGGAVSIAANVAHSFVPPVGAPAGWRPMHGAVLGAVFWPVALFVAIEILARTRWPAGLSWRLIRLGGLLPVALVAAVVSYRHLSGLLRHYGEDGLTATFGPLAVDGLMAVASAALLAASSHPAAVASAAPASRVASDPTSEATSAASPSPERGDPSPSTVDPGGSRGADRPRPQLDDARAFVRTEFAAGRTPSGVAVGRRYGRNSRWGQRVVREVLSPQARSTSTPGDEAVPDHEPAPIPHQVVHIGRSHQPGSTPPESGAEIHTKALQSDGSPAGAGERAGRST